MSVKQKVKIKTFTGSGNFDVREEMLKDSNDLLDNVEVTTIAQECVKLKGKEDYLLAVGDPVIIGISTWLVGETTNGQFNMLKWDKREYRYYPLEVDGYQKG